MNTRTIYPIIFALLTLLVAPPILLSGGGSVHSDFTVVLKRHVRGGTVNYSKLKDDKGLSSYLSALSNSKPGALSGDEKKAFWINAYNAFTLKVIVNNWPVKSIRDINGGKVWDKKWIMIDSKTYSLNQIENEILRPMGDARVHYALVCAAKGCPPLRSDAYMPSTLSKQLDEQARQYVRRGPGHSYSVKTKTAKVSQLYKWYASDFGKGSVGLIKHLAQFSDLSIAKVMKQSPGAWKVEYVKYDWTINGR